MFPKDFLINYDNILFDLDDTIYSKDVFDYRQYLSFFKKYYSFKRAKILASELLNYKKTSPKNYKFVFNDFIKDKSLKLDIKDFLTHYHSPKPDILKNTKSLYNILNEIYTEKNLFLISNGYLNTQIKKIESLNIKKFFQKVFILSPGLDIRLKPFADVMKFIPIEKHKSVYIGNDLEIDLLFSKNAGIDFIHYEFNEEL